MECEIGKILYRYNTVSGSVPQISEWRVVKKTKLGYWLEHTEWTAFRKWTAKKSKNHYAWPTMEEAALSYVRRKERYLELSEIQYSKSRKELRLAKESFKHYIDSGAISLRTVRDYLIIFDYDTIRYDTIHPDSNSQKK